MDIKQLQQGLENKFSKSRMVFWHDPEQSFVEIITQLQLDSVVILNMAGASFLQTKKRIELDEPNNKFLLYFDAEVPIPEKDWFLDIREYSESFYADVSSLILNELGITQMALRPYITQRSAFFASKQRLAKLKRWITEQESESSLDLKMIAVLTKAESSNANDVVLSCLSSLVDNEDGSWLLDELGKFGLVEALWQLLAEAFGYVSEQPSMAEWVLRLFSTELWAQTETTQRSWLSDNLLKGAAGRSNALAFMKNWRYNGLYKHDFAVLSVRLANQLNVAERYQTTTPYDLAETETFEALEQHIIRGLVGELLNFTEGFEQLRFEQLLSSRLTRFWVKENGQYEAIYKALREALNLILLRNQYAKGFYFESAKALYQAYESELYQFDQSYRLFNEYAQKLFNVGSDILRQLDEAIENLYSGWFLNGLSLAWDGLLAIENRMNTWQFDGVARQSDFYQNQVAYLLKATQLKRVFVVISDALRFEVANEFVQHLNERKQFKAKITSQLGVLPSYTQLGMASLLPHKQISYLGNGGIVSVDGMSTQGLESRNAILNKVNGLAVSAKDLMTWTNQEGREAVRGFEVVYIYHNTIDDICDKQGGEDRTPQVCRDAINELSDLMGRIINRLNGSRVILTADHGFLFQQQSLEKSDKTELLVKPKDAIETKKRYILGKSLASHEFCWKGSINNTVQGGDETEFLLPKGVQRFHFVGGAKFVHGGAALQEVCVPVVEVQELEGKKIATHQKKPVGCVVVNQPIKFVNNIDKIRLIQSDAVNEEFKARELELFIQDSSGQCVSSRELVLLDSKADSMDLRIKDVRLKLVGKGFDRHHSYQLILKDVASNTNFCEYAVKIDLAIQDDF